jgi:putative acetyltransferase
MVIVRQEEQDDIAAIRQVNEQAFGRAAEATLVERLRAGGGVCLSLVAVVDKRLVGHILFSPVTIVLEQGTFAVLGLAPLAVAPAWQRQGIGSRLVQHGLAACRRAAYAGVVVLGSPAYYRRFGFVPAQRFGIQSEYAVPDDVFMVIELRAGALRGHAGVARYAPEFQTVSA